MQTVKAHSANSFLALMLLVVVCMSSFNFFHTKELAPYTELKARALTPLVRFGDPLGYEIQGRRNKLCGVSVSRGFVDLNSGIMVHQEFVPAGFVALGAFKLSINAQLPKHMGPSRYAMRGLQTNDCGDEVFVLPYPDVTFEIVSQD